MKRMNIFLSILILNTALISAQDAKLNSMRINIGIGNLQKQDLIFSPFISRDWSPLNFLLEYDHDGKLDQKVSIRFGQYFNYVGEPFSYFYRGIEYDKYPHSFSNIDLSYSLSKSFIQTNQWKISAGGRIRNRFQISSYQFGESGQSSFHLSNGLDALLNIEYKSDRHTLQSEIALPLFSYLARSPYTGQDDQYLEEIMVHGDLKIFVEHLKSGTFQSWGKSQMLDFNLSYEFVLNEKWNLGVTYLFLMNLHSTPLRYTSIENVLYLGTTLKF